MISVREMELSLSKYNNGFPRTKFKIWQSIEEGVLFYSFLFRPYLNFVFGSNFNRRLVVTIFGYYFNCCWVVTIRLKFNEGFGRGRTIFVKYSYETMNMLNREALHFIDSGFAN